MISWLQAVALFVSIELELESHEQIELVLWLVVAAFFLNPYCDIFYKLYQNKKHEIADNRLGF